VGTHLGTTLDVARTDAGLSNDELWARYFGLGGMAMPLEVEAFLLGLVEPSAHDHEVLVHALNERFSELGRNHPVPHGDGAGASDSLGAGPRRGDPTTADATPETEEDPDDPPVTH